MFQYRSLPDRRPSAVTVLLLLTMAPGRWWSTTSLAAPVVDAAAAAAEGASLNSGETYENVASSPLLDDADHYMSAAELPFGGEHIPNRASHVAVDGKSGHHRTRDETPFPAYPLGPKARDDEESMSHWYDAIRKMSLNSDNEVVDDGRPSSDWWNPDYRSASVIGNARSKKRVHYGFHAIRGKRQAAEHKSTASRRMIPKNN